MPIMTRRAALTAAAGAAAVAAIVPSIQASEQARADAHLPVRSDFAGAIGTTFVAATDAERVELVLAAIGDIAGAPAGDENAFSLEFTATHLPTSGTYALTAPGVRDAVLFLSPIAADRVEIVVNRRA